MRTLFALIFLIANPGLSAGELDPIKTVENIEEAKTFPEYSFGDKLREFPVENSMMGLGGLSTFYLDEEALVNLKFTGEVYLRDWLSARGSVVVPLQKNGDRFLPFLLQAGGSLHFWSPASLDFYVPMLAGFEINRNDSDRSAAQPYVEVGGGGQIFVDSLFVLRLEFAYHFSYIPQDDDSYVDHYYPRAEAAIGVFF